MSNAPAPQKNKSTGPRTEAGKARSRWNARLHNLTGQTIVTTEEERIVFDESAKLLIDDLQPQGEFEISLVKSIAESQWQLNRARAIEANMFFELTANNLPDDDPNTEELTYREVDIAQAQALAFIENGRHFDLMGRYANRFHRQVIQITATFFKARTDRRKQSEKADRQRLRDESHSLANFQKTAASPGARKPSFEKQFVSQPHVQAALNAPLTKTEMADIMRNLKQGRAA